MPRIRDSRSSPYDFCHKCFPKTEDLAMRQYGDLGDGPDGRGNCFAYDDDHPDYEGEDYKCLVCRRPLTNDDNYGA